MRSDLRRSDLDEAAAASHWDHIGRIGPGGSVLRVTQKSVALIGRATPRQRVLGYGAVLLAIGSALLVITPAATAMPERDWTPPFLGLVLAFGLAEATALHVEIRKESHSLSLSGIPLMFGLLYFSPALLALAYMLGGAPALIWIRKSDLIKAVWNSCLFFAEAALAAFVVRSLLGEGLPVGFAEWLVPLAAILSAELMSLLAVPLVIMAVDARFRPNLFAEVGQSQILAALAGTFTVIAVSASVESPWMVSFAIVPLIGVGVLLRNHGRLNQRHNDLHQLHGFTRALTNERGARTIDTGLVELVQIMRSKSAGLLVVEEDRTSTFRVLIDDSIVDLDPEPLAPMIDEVLEHGPIVHIAADDPRRAAKDLLEHLGAGEVLLARVLGEVNRKGVLMVADRLGMAREFRADEVRLFASLSRTLSARLANDHLVEQLETQAQHDALTGLPNRLSFEVALTSSLAKTEESGVVVMIDLDRFKEINDSLGHETGDQLLIEVARRLRKTTRSADLVARFGGDEFAMLLTHRNSDGPGDFTRRLSDIHEQLTGQVELDGIKFEIGASFGVAQWPQQGSSSAGLLHRADTAMYQAKRNQLGVVWYSPDLDADAPRRLDLYLSVPVALENDELYVHFQPKVSAVDGHITGAEALVRWTHPAHGPISPAEFVPLIAQAGMTGKLTRFVVRRSAEMAATLRDAGVPMPIAVNFTPRDLLDSTLPDDIVATLREVGVDPSLLLVEITEDAMVVDFETSAYVLTRLRSLGVQVAIDDFGTGYSSLQHLHMLPVDQLKIDRSFVGRLAEDSSAAAIVRASISLARDLGLTSVAEGVEDERSLRLVADLGCQQIQGYLVCRPLPTPEFLGWALGWQPEWLVSRLNEDVFETRHHRVARRLGVPVG